MQTISLHDDLTFSHRPDEQLQLNCNDPDIPTDEGNLIVRAANALKERFQVKAGAQIDLLKRIPARGGLGGGSSNAAVALLGLSYLWQINLSRPDLLKLGAKLGTDVPFFFFAGRALATGIGTEISPLEDLPSQSLIIIFPNANVSTAKAYQALRAPSLTSENSVSILTSSFAEPFLDNYDQWTLRNDFEAVIFEIEPEIKRARIALLDAGAQGALLAGSGSCVFGIFDGEAAQRRALENLRSEDGWRIFSCDTLARNEYFRAMGPLDTPLLRSF